jgi:hypothetical protein
MEADWEFGVGGDAPVIEALWQGFVDLQRTPELAWHLPESARFPALAEALANLNDADSPIWTSKCDFWPHLEPDEFDPDEMDAPPGRSTHAMGCYFDLLPKSGQLWAQPAMAEAVCKRLCGNLRAVPLVCCRTDLVIRRAFLTPERMDLGVTAYLTACGESPAASAQTLQAALAAFTDAILGIRPGVTMLPE